MWDATDDAATLKERREAFRETIWRKRPLLVRKAVDAEARAAGDADDVAGLACEPDVASRLVDAALRVTAGPFDEDRLAALPEDESWSLLINDADRCLPALSNLWPDVLHQIWGEGGGWRWRRDDVMASVASGGGVGPHVDSSDVFLLQASGRRRWSVQLEYVEEAAQSDAAGVCRTLPDFKADAAWVLEPGDVLYVPPYIPHEGVAFGGAEVCSTLSFGLRTYDSKQLAARWVEDELLGGTAALVDAPLTGDAATVGVDDVAVVRDAVRAALRDALDDDAAFARFLGALVTEPRAPPVADDEDDGCWRDAVAEAAGGVRVESLDAADAVCRGLGARLARVGATPALRGRRLPGGARGRRFFACWFDETCRGPRRVSAGAARGARGGGDLVFVAFESDPSLDDACGPQNGFFFRPLQNVGLKQISSSTCTNIAYGRKSALLSSPSRDVPRAVSGVDSKSVSRTAFFDASQLLLWERGGPNGHERAVKNAP